MHLQMINTSWLKRDSKLQKPATLISLYAEGLCAQITRVIAWGPVSIWGRLAIKGTKACCNNYLAVLSRCIAEPQFVSMKPLEPDWSWLGYLWIPHLGVKKTISSKTRRQLSWPRDERQVCIPPATRQLSRQQFPFEAGALGSCCAALFWRPQEVTGWQVNPLG